MKSKALFAIMALCLVVSTSSAQTQSNYFQDPLAIKRLLMDEATAENCLACSHTGGLIAKFINENPRTILVAHHGGNGFKDPFYLPKDDISTYFFNGPSTISSYPMIMLDRRITANAQSEANVMIWDGYILYQTAADRLAEKPEAMIKIEGDYDTSTQEITLRIKADLPTEPQAKALRLVLYVVEDDVLHINQALPKPMPYKHHGLVRDVILGSVGEAITPAAGTTTYTKTLTYDISDAHIAQIEATQAPAVKQRPWNRNNIRFVAALANYPEPDTQAADWPHKRYLSLKESRVYSVDQARITDMGKVRSAVRVASDKENVKIEGEEYYVQGTQVKVKTNKREGLLCWSIDGAKVDAAEDGSCTFTMPAKAIVAKAIYNTENIPDHTEQIQGAPERISIFPNPARTVVSLQGTHSAVSVYDVRGQRVYHNELTESINVSEWPRGSYIVAVKTPQGLISVKLELH